MPPFSPSVPFSASTLTRHRINALAFHRINISITLRTRDSQRDPTP